MAAAAARVVAAHCGSGSNGSSGTGGGDGAPAVASTATGARAPLVDAVGRVALRLRRLALRRCRPLFAPPLAANAVPLPHGSFLSLPAPRARALHDAGACAARDDSDAVALQRTSLRAQR